MILETLTLQADDSSQDIIPLFCKHTVLDIGPARSIVPYATLTTLEDLSVKLIDIADSACFRFKTEDQQPQ